MNYTNLLTTVTWNRGFRLADVFRDTEADSRKAVFVEDLDPDWVHALESADYGHLPELKKQTA